MRRTEHQASLGSAGLRCTPRLRSLPARGREARGLLQGDSSVCRLSPMATRWPWRSGPLRIAVMAGLVAAAPGLSPPAAASQDGVAGPTLEIGTPLELSLAATATDAAGEFGLLAAADGSLTVEA